MYHPIAARKGPLGDELDAPEPQRTPFPLAPARAPELHGVIAQSELPREAPEGLTGSPPPLQKCIEPLPQLNRKWTSSRAPLRTNQRAQLFNFLVAHATDDASPTLDLHDGRPRGDTPKTYSSRASMARSETSVPTNIGSSHSAMLERNRGLARDYKNVRFTLADLTPAEYAQSLTTNRLSTVQEAVS